MDSFVQRYGKRLAETDLSNEEMYEIYRTEGDDAFLIQLERAELFVRFCQTYYDFLREHWNACGALMQEEFERFTTEFDSNQERYWVHIKQRARR